MSTLVEIKEAIAHLSPQEFCELMADLQPFADDEWDLQMKADDASGKLDFVDRHIEAAQKAGTLLPLEPNLEKIGTSQAWEPQSFGTSTVVCLPKPAFSLEKTTRFGVNFRKSRKRQNGPRITPIPANGEDFRSKNKARIFPSLFSHLPDFIRVLSRNSRAKPLLPIL
jgi:hypothetical protein